MIYLLGGPPRIGKSIISAQICKRHGISVVSADSLGAVLEQVVTPEIEPDLFALARFNELSMADRVQLMSSRPNEWLNYAIAESRIVWKAVKAFLAKEQGEGRDVLIEGVAVLPELVAQLQDIDYHAVFVGNQGGAVKDNIQRGAMENCHDWMRSMNDEYMAAFAAVVTRMSTYLEEEAERFGFRYLEIGNQPFCDLAGMIVRELDLTAR